MPTTPGYSWEDNILILFTAWPWPARTVSRALLVWKQISRPVSSSTRNWGSFPSPDTSPGDVVVALLDWDDKKKKREKHLDRILAEKELWLLGGVSQREISVLFTQLYKSASVSVRYCSNVKDFDMKKCDYKRITTKLNTVHCDIQCLGLHDEFSVFPSVKCCGFQYIVATVLWRVAASIQNVQSRNLPTFWQVVIED